MSNLQQGRRQRIGQQRTALWIYLLGLFFLLAIFDGALRKWVMPDLSLFLYLLKDAVLVVSFGLYLFSGGPIRLPRPASRHFLSLALGGYIYVVLLQAFNFAHPNLKVVILGLKSHLAYIPLIVLIPALLARLHFSRLERVVFAYMSFVAFPVILLGIYQFFQPPNSWVNKYVRDMGYISKVSGHARITGTFSYLSGMTKFMVFNTLLGFGSFIGGVLSNRRWLAWGGGVFFGLCLIVLPLPGSRSAVYKVALVIPGISLLILSLRGGFSALVKGAILGGCLVLLVISQTGLSESWMTFEDRIQKAGLGEDRVVNFLSGPILGIERAGLFGFGVGTMHQSAPTLVAGSSSHTWIPGGYVETKTARIVMELGALGWLILLMLKVTAAWMACQVLLRAASVLEIIVGVVAVGETVIYSVFPVVFNPVSGIAYWTALALGIFVWSRQQMRARPQAIA